MPLTGLRAVLQGSSRYSTRMASAGSIEQAFVSLEDGIRRLTLPLPTGPKHVHCYLADGTLFDTGLGLGDAPWESVEVERIAITHFHPDHVGGAQAAAAVTGADVFQGGLDYAQCERGWGSAHWPERMAAWFIELAPRVVYPGHGEPIHDAAGRARELIAHHRDRLEVTAAALTREPRTAYE